MSFWTILIVTAVVVTYCVYQFRDEIIELIGDRINKKND